MAHANPSEWATRLYQTASRVGRAHITSVINTLVLAYAGISLPLLILLAAGNSPLGQVLTTQMLAQEIVRRRRRHDGADGRRADHHRAGRYRGAACPGEGRRQGAETGTPRWRRSSFAKEVRTGGWLSAPPDEVAHLGPGRDAQLPQDVRDVNGGGLR
ncbi:YibE/F family protein [Actinophytocola sp.]|uniref:YibE/F family protein n=1 Tax=Actinophytocola sp. TaxID=1872138 RepID=UPI0039C8BD90